MTSAGESLPEGVETELPDISENEAGAPMVMPVTHADEIGDKEDRDPRVVGELPADQGPGDRAPGEPPSSEPPPGPEEGT